MALTLIKEDGTGRTDANSYATVAEADSYFEAHLYASAWTAAPAGEGIESTATSTHTKTSSSDTSSSSTTKYSKSDTRPIVSQVAQAMLSKYGALIVGGSGSVQLVRA